VRSAQAYRATGVFAGADGTPDFHRTVGYPAFLALAMVVGGEAWVERTWILQAVLFAFIYPALAYLARKWFGATDRQTDLLLLVYALVGAGWAYTPILLTDQMFTVCLWSSLALGTMAVTHGRLLPWLGHFALLGAAASIRPVLGLFPLGFSALIVATASGSAVRRTKPALCRMVAIVFALQALLCQAPAIRNYIHHGVWIPSDVMVNNLSDYLAKDALAFAGDSETYAKAEAGWKEAPLRERLAEQAAFAKSVLAAHPFATLTVAGVNFGMNTLETHWIQAMHYFRPSLHCDLKRWCALTPALKTFHALWALIEAGLVLAACCGLWRMARQRRWAFLLFILALVLPYLYGSTVAQGARFRLYLEGLILMLAFLACPGAAPRRSCHGS
jgi:hypothetical protein